MNYRFHGLTEGVLDRQNSNILAVKVPFRVAWEEKKKCCHTVSDMENGYGILKLGVKKA